MSFVNIVLVGSEPTASCHLGFAIDIYLHAPHFCELRGPQVYKIEWNSMVNSNSIAKQYGQFLCMSSIKKCRGPRDYYAHDSACGYNVCRGCNRLIHVHTCTYMLVIRMLHINKHAV